MNNNSLILEEQKIELQEDGYLYILIDGFYELYFRADSVEKLTKYLIESNHRTPG